jgi:UDP-3-O-[3-hydroxymyristoyl] N-acetylglucosamine deacetylase/3-hydroxyacyl-[acyl-carrier-protein] dehydratase
VEEVRKKGLIRGGSLDNAIVIGEDGIVNQDLRFEDEIVRHKVLDVLGDLALLGKPLKGHIIGVRSGHASNVKFVKKILEETEMPAKAPLTIGKNLNLPIEADDLRKLLPHRYPFLLVDRIIEVNPEDMTAVGIKNVTVNEPHFTGHWPNQAVMPGVLQVEAMAQVGGILLMLDPRFTDKIGYLMAIDGVKFRRRVIPGDRLRIEAQINRVRGANAQLTTRITVDGNPVTEAQILYRVDERPEW